MYTYIYIYIYTDNNNNYNKTNSLNDNSPRALASESLPAERSFTICYYSIYHFSVTIIRQRHEFPSHAFR